VARLIHTGFYRCLTDAVPLLSTHGVKTADQIRMYQEDVTQFCKQIPMIPQSFMDTAKEFLMDQAQSGILRHVSLGDVLKELSNRILSEVELISLLKWWLEYIKESQVSRNQIENFYGATLVKMEPTPMPLHSIRNYINPKLICPTMEFPRTTLPYSVSRELSTTQLQQLG
jgi:hypothetical protein